MANLEHDRRAVEYNERLKRKAQQAALTDVEGTVGVKETTVAVMNTEEQLNAIFTGVLKSVIKRQKRVELFMKLPKRQTDEEKNRKPAQVSLYSDLSIASMYITLNRLHKPAQPVFPAPLTSAFIITPCGTVDKIGNGGGNGSRLVVSGMLPDQEELQTWMAESQILFWDQRKRE